MNQEAVNDCAKLIMHRLIARRLVADPGMIARALVRLDEIGSRVGERDFVVDWRRLLTGDVLELRRALGSRDEHMTWLRSSTPFSATPELPLSDPTLRRRIWRLARSHVLMGQSVSEANHVEGNGQDGPRPR